jgi:N-acyl-D-aspartate/D-glutamate deacylase
MAAYDLVFSGGTVVDGSGRPSFVADVALRKGKIAAIGKLDGGAARRVDAAGLVVAPGVIDVHSHYDAQVCWDGLLSGSAEHGTTTVIQGNCGIGVAPCRPEDREATVQDLCAIEGMSYDVLSAGIDWQFETFPEYLDAIRQRGIGINLGAFVPLSPLRRYVLGDEASERPATVEERAAIGALLREALEAGALGFSLTKTSHHIGYKGRPLACRIADNAELAAYANVLQTLGRGAIQLNPWDRSPYCAPEELELVTMLLAESGRPVTFSGAHYRAEDPPALERMLKTVAPLRAQGGMPQSMIRPLTVALSLRTPFVFATLPAFAALFDEPLEAQKRVYADGTWRARVKDDLRTHTTTVGDRWRNATVLRVRNARLQPLVGTSVQAIAAERGVDVFDAMIDLALEDDLETRFLLELRNTDPEQLRAHIADPRIMIGLADGGAHVDQLFESGFPTYMLGHWVRREGAITLEHAVKRMTSEPASYFGLRDRGRVAEGAAADLMVFDPHTVDSAARPNEVRADLPGGGERLYAGATGVAFVVVNGQVLYEHGKHTGALPGAIVADN